MPRYNLRILLPVIAIILVLSTVYAFRPKGDAASAAAESKVLLKYNFARPSGIITNEYAFWNPHSSAARQSKVWQLTSGSLFARRGHGWTGVPDGANPNATSSNATGSAVFRLTTRKSSFGSVRVFFRLWNKGLVATPRTPRTDWDGIHVFLRYRSEQSLYYVSVNRRDNSIAIKKKVRGGPSNGGTYYTLASRRHVVPYRQWQRVATSIRTNPDSSVTIRLRISGRQLLEATDRGRGGVAPYTAGNVGLRADNCNMLFDDFVITSLH